MSDGHHPLRCFACRELFSDAHSEGTKVRHTHHVIPRAFGGANGPTVDVCNEDHDLLHRLALRVISKKLEPSGIRTFAYDDEHYKKLSWLVSRVCMAQAATKNDPNKKVPVTVVLSGEEARSLDLLKKVFNRKSRQDVLKLLLAEAVNKNLGVLR